MNTPLRLFAFCFPLLLGLSFAACDLAESIGGDGDEGPDYFYEATLSATVRQGDSTWTFIPSESSPNFNTYAPHNESEITAVLEGLDEVYGYLWVYFGDLAPGTHPLGDIGDCLSCAPSARYDYGVTYLTYEDPSSSEGSGTYTITTLELGEIDPDSGSEVERIAGTFAFEARDVLNTDTVTVEIEGTFEAQRVLLGE